MRELWQQRFASVKLQENFQRAAQNRFNLPFALVPQNTFYRTSVTMAFFEWLKSTVGGSPKKQSHSERSKQNVFPRVYDSQLEDRRVLNAGAVVSAIDLVSLQFDAGKSANDGAADKFELTRLSSANGASQIAVSINDQRVWQGSSAELQSIRLDGSSDVDQFLIDPTIQIPSGVYVNGTGAATGQQSPGTTDIVVFATASGMQFDEIAYQTNDQFTQVRFASSSLALDSVVRVQNVESIHDLNKAMERTIEVGSQGKSYSLGTASETEFIGENRHIQFSSQSGHIDFAAPSQLLSIDLQSAIASKNTLAIDTIDLSGTKQFKVLGGETDRIAQSGVLSAGAKLSIEAGTILVDGTISTGPEGELRLDATSGLLTVNGEIYSQGDDSHRGGNIVLTGQRVLIQDGARIDASGGTGGGQIRVGGGYQGKDSSVRNSRYTFVSSDASLYADARLKGNGGTIIVWSDDVSIIDGSGNIFARGGVTSGDGGFIETSGKRFLKVDGAANAAAYHGKAGTWLLDPDNIEIVTTAGSTPLTSYVLISTINSTLVNTDMVIITNTASAGAGDITIVDAATITPAAARTLTLDATRDIVFSSGLTGNANLQLILTAGRDVDTTAASIGQLGSLSIDAARNIRVGAMNLSGGSFTATIDSDNNSNASFQSTGALSAGSISIVGSTTPNDDVTLGASATTTSGAIQFTKIDNLTFQGDVTSATGITFTSVTGPLSLSSNADITANNGPIDFSSITSGILLAGSNGSTNILTANGATGSLTLGAVSATNATVSLTLSSAFNTSVGSINIQDGTLSVAIDSDNNNANATFQSNGALSAGAISITGSTTVNDDVTIGSTATTSTGSIQFSKVDDLLFQADVSSAIGITFTNVAGPLSLGSNVDVIANNGSIDFSNITAGLLLAGNNGSTNILTSSGTTGNLTLGGLTATNATVSLTLSSATNISVGSINIQNGTLSATIDFNNDDANATFQSTGALSAGSISITGSTTVNDDVTLGSTATTTTGSILFSKVDDLSLQGDVSSATTVTFTNVAGPLSLGSNADITASNGALNFSSITSGVLLAGSNGSTNILTAGGAAGSLTLGSVTATNSTVSLTLSSATNTSVGSINIQSGTLSTTIDSDDDNGNATFQSTGALSAGAMSITGSTTVNDDVTLGSTATTTTGSIQFSKVDDLSLQGDVSSATSITSTNVTGPLSLSSNVDLTANNGSIDLSGIVSGILLAGSNGSTNVFTANSVSGSLALGNVTTTNSTVALTLSSATNTSVGSINIQNGTLSVTIDSDDNDNNATFQSTGALAAGSMSITGSTTVNDDVTIGSTATTSTGSIQFSKVDDLLFQADVSSAIGITFTNVAGPLSLGSNVDVIANNGPIDFSSITAGLLLAGNNGSTNILTSSGTTGNLTLGGLTATNATVSLTLSSATNISVGSINIQNGTLSATIDFNNDDANATFQSTGALSAGSISITGSTTVNDDVTLGSTATTTTGSIQFSKIDDLSLQGDVSSATNVTFTNVAGPLSLGSNVDVTANNGSIDFSTIGSDILLAGSNGSTNILTASGATGSLTLANVTAANLSVSLTLRSANNVSALAVDLQSGTLDVGFNELNTAGVNLASFNAVTAGRLEISGNSQIDDQVQLNGISTIGSGGVLIDQYNDLEINADVTSTGNITATGIGGSATHLSANVTSNGGSIALTGGTLFIDGSAARTIFSGGGGVATGGSILLGSVDGENGAANLTVDSRGTTTGGAVTIGTVAASSSGLNRLNIRTDAATTSGQVTLSSTRLVAKTPSVASTLVVGTNGQTILANGVIDLSSTNTTNGGSIDFGVAKVAAETAASTLTLRTSNTNASGGDGGDIKFGGVTNSGANYFDSVLIDTNAANGAKTDGDLDFGGQASPSLAVDGTSGTGITLIGAIVKTFTGILSFLTNPTSASVNSSSIDVSKADFKTTNGLTFDTSGGGASTNAGDVLLGDIGVVAIDRPNSVVVDTRGSVTTGDLLLDDGGATSTEVHVAGDLNLANTNIKLADNAVLRTYGTGNIALGDVATSTAVARNLTLNSEASIAVSAINLTGGTLDASIDSNNNDVGSTFSSSGSLTAGVISLSGSAATDDDVTIQSNATTSTGAIQFSQFDQITLNGDVSAATIISFANVVSQLALGTGADLTSNNGPLDLSVLSGLQLVGSNGSTNILTSKGATGSLTLGSVSATNPSTSLTLRSTTNTSVGSINIQNGVLDSRIDTDNNNVGSTFVATGALTAGSVTIAGSNTVNDDVTLGSTVTTTTGAIQVTQFDDLQINDDWNSAGAITTTGVIASETHLAANVTSNGGNIAMTGGTLLVNGTSVRQIKSGGATVTANNGGSVTLGDIDGEVATAELEIDARGITTSGDVVIGDVAPTTNYAGVNRLTILTDGAAPGQVNLSSMRMIGKAGTPSSLTVSAGSRTVLANGAIDLSSNNLGLEGGNVDFGNSLVAPKTSNSTLTINTSNTNATVGIDGSNGGSITLGGIGVNSTDASYFDSVVLDLSIADSLDSAGTLRFGTIANPSLQVDGSAGTGIRILGRIDNVAGGVLSFLTNPAGAAQNTTAIDVSRASFINSGGLVLNTSGSNNALNAGSISLGDVGTIIRPVSLVVDTRGTVSSGHLLLNDGVTGSATEIIVDGTIDFSNVTIDLLDDVLIQSRIDGNNVLLGVTNASGGTRNLQLDSDSGITVAAINLSGGAFQANLDVNNNEIGAIFRSDGTINAGSVAVNGSLANDDIADIRVGATTSGQIRFSNLDRLKIQGTAAAGLSFIASNIVGAVELNGNSGISANGSIDLLTTVNSIVLSGVAGNVALIDATGNASLVKLTSVTAANAGLRLNVRSDYSVDLQNTDMLTGTLDVLFGRSTALTDANALVRQVVAGGIVIAGTSTANDVVVLNGLLDVGANGINIQNLARLDVNFDVQSDGSIVANNILDRILVAESVDVLSDQNIDLQTNVGQIQLAGGIGVSTNTFRTNGDASSLRLASIHALHDVILVLSSANNINLNAIDAIGSNLLIEVDNNGNTVGSRLDAGDIQAAQISILGSSTRDDIANFTGRVESKTGSILVDAFSSVDFNGDLLSAQSLEVSNVSSRMTIHPGRLVKALNGNVNFNNNLNEIRFAGGVGTTSTIQSLNGSLFASALTETSTSSLIELRADRDVVVQSALLDSNLKIVAGDHNSSTGTINSSFTLDAASISLEAATGIGTSSAVATSTTSLNASSRLSGPVQIDNNKSGTIEISNLVANGGGNIVFNQSGGGTVRFDSVVSNPDGTPAVNEGDIRLSNVGDILTIDGTGVSAGGLGNIVLETQSEGDVQLNATTRAVGGTVGIHSARRIIGVGTIQGTAIDLTANTGIGTTGPLNTETTQLSVNSQIDSVDVRNSSAGLTNVSQLRSGISGTVQFTQVGGGDVAFSGVETGLALTHAGSNINLRNDNGSVLVQGSVLAGGGGSIRFDAQNNLVIGSGAIVQTNGANATIRGDAAGQFIFTPGATLRAGSSNPTTEAVVTRIPPLVSVRPTLNSLGVNVDSEGTASIQIQIGGPTPPFVDRNFSVVIDWGDTEIDHFPNGSISPLTINPLISRFDASGAVYQITHQYQGNPNLSDPIADIPVTVTLGIDALNRIQFNDSTGPVTSLSQVVNESFVVPAAGLFTLRVELPQAATPQSRIIFNTETIQTADRIAPAISSPEIVVSSGSSAVEKGRAFVLRIITPVNEQGAVDSSEDIELSDQDIEDLSSGKLFQKLGDNRYRIYLIREDGNEILLKDFYLRNHRPVEIEDAMSPSIGLPTDEPVLEKAPAAIQNQESVSANVDAGKFDLVEPDAEQQDMKNIDKFDEKPITHATVAVGTVTQAMRSWRKAARRFRAG